VVHNAYIYIYIYIYALGTAYIPSVPRLVSSLSVPFSSFALVRKCSVPETPCVTQFCVCLNMCVCVRACTYVHA